MSESGAAVVAVIVDTFEREAKIWADLLAALPRVREILLHEDHEYISLCSDGSVVGGTPDNTVYSLRVGGKDDPTAKEFRVTIGGSHRIYLDVSTEEKVKGARGVLLRLFYGSMMIHEIQKKER